MAEAFIQPSFAAGELSPTLHARVDINKYQVGAALLRNLFVDYRGGVSNRPGTLYVGRCRVSGTGRISEDFRLVPFRFSTRDTYVLEFGHHYLRVVRYGGYVVEPRLAITSISNARPAVVTYDGGGLETGDRVFVTGAKGLWPVNRKTFRIERQSDTAVSLSLDESVTPARPGGRPFDTTDMPAYTGGGRMYRVFTLQTPYADHELDDIHFVQSADVLTLVHPDHPPRDLIRRGHTDWDLEEITFAAEIGRPTITSIGGGSGDNGVHVPPGSSGPNSVYYVVTAINEFGEESLPSDPKQSGGFSSESNSNKTFMISWSQVEGAVSYNIYRSAKATSRDGDANVAGRFGFIDSVPGRSYDDNVNQGVFATAQDYSKTPPRHRNPFAPGTIEHIRVVNQGSNVPTNAQVTVEDPTGSGFIGYPVIRGNKVSSIVILNGGENYTNNATVTVGDATFEVEVGPRDGVWPSKTGYFQQRKVYAATKNEPEAMHLSKTGLYNNFDYEIPAQDDDSISVSLESREVNNVASMVGMPDGLLTLTGSGSRMVRGDSPGAAVTPGNILAVEQPTVGSADLDALLVGDTVLYVTLSGQVVRDVRYDFASNSYTGTDISVLANHLFVGDVISTWTSAEDPHKLVWAADESGRLRCLTYLREQEVVAWTSHETDGEVVSLATIPERIGELERNSFQDVTYMIVRRFIGGEWVYSTERMMERRLVDQAGNDIGLDGAWFLDAALRLEPWLVNATCEPDGTKGRITCVVKGEFGASFVGLKVRVGGGRGICLAEDGDIATGLTITVDLDRPIRDVMPDGRPRPARPGEWSAGPDHDSVRGVDHLEGRTVRVLGDGRVLGDFVVKDGTVGPFEPSSVVIAGLPYKARLQTLPFDVAGGGTIQGKRKKIAALTVRVHDTTGILAGYTFDTLMPFKFQGVPDGTTELVTTDQRIVMNTGWTVEGQYCIEQPGPLPVTVLGIIPEVTGGDTAG